VIDDPAKNEQATEPALDGSLATEWFLATPARMARVVASAYQVHLAAYGLKAMRAEMIGMRAEDAAASKLDGLEQQPVDQALQAALPVVADAFAEAMAFYSMWQWAIDAIEAQVRDEVDKVIIQHLKLRAEQEREPATPSTGFPAEPEPSATEGVVEDAPARGGPASQ
jgi:hypothetical protein